MLVPWALPLQKMHYQTYRHLDTLENLFQYALLYLLAQLPTSFLNNHRHVKIWLVLNTQIIVNLHATSHISGQDKPLTNDKIL